MRLFRTLGAIVLSVGLTSALPGPATAAPAQDFGNGIIATYKGKSINLSQGWQGAQACAEFAIGDVRCYDTAAEANLATQPTGEMSTLGRPDCPSTWVCIWEHADFTGRRLKWSEPGAKKLANRGFETRRPAFS